jgi:hypothetical protein
MCICVHLLDHLVDLRYLAAPLPVHLARAVLEVAVDAPKGGFIWLFVYNWVGFMCILGRGGVVLLLVLLLLE